MFCTFQDGDTEASNKMRSLNKIPLFTWKMPFWGKVVGGELAGNDLELFSQSLLTLQLILIERSVSAQ